MLNPFCRCARVAAENVHGGLLDLVPDDILAGVKEAVDKVFGDLVVDGKDGLELRRVLVASGSVVDIRRALGKSNKIRLSGITG